MNANKLADKLDEIYTGTDYEDIKLAATMLRQQQAEIEALKKKNEDRESAIYATGYWNGIAKKNERA
jgi:hypothetical protein